MFNRTPFNRGRFNRRTSGVIFIYGHSDIEICADGKLKSALALAGEASKEIKTAGAMTFPRHLDADECKLAITSDGRLFSDTSLSSYAQIALKAKNHLSTVICIGISSKRTNARFNRMGFNRGKFNSFGHIVSHAPIGLKTESMLTTIISIYGETYMALKAESTLKRATAFSGYIPMEITTAQDVSRLRGIDGDLPIKLTAVGDTQRLRGLSGDTPLELTAAGSMIGSWTIRGYAPIILKVDETRLSGLFGLAGTAAKTLSTTGRVNIILPFAGAAPINLATAGRLNLVSVLAGNLFIVLTATVTARGFLIFITEHIHLPSLILRPGELLIIDTDNMTITVNGQNVMRHLSRDSEFFLFSPENNDVTFQNATPTGQANITMLWRDTWL